jgi:hypothetical protein
MFAEAGKEFGEFGVAVALNIAVASIEIICNPIMGLILMYSG